MTNFERRDEFAAGADYYELLGVEPDATAGQIKQAFRKLALKYHPDHSDGQEDGAEKRFHAVHRAYEVLADPVKRRKYDAQRLYRTGGPQRIKIAGINIDREEVVKHAKRSLSNILRILDGAIKKSGFLPDEDKQ